MAYVSFYSSLAEGRGIGRGYFSLSSSSAQTCSGQNKWRKGRALPATKLKVLCKKRKGKKKKGVNLHIQSVGTNVPAGRPICRADWEGR